MDQMILLNESNYTPKGDKLHSQRIKLYSKRVIYTPTGVKSHSMSQIAHTESNYTPSTHAFEGGILDIGDSIPIW